MALPYVGNNDFRGYLNARAQAGDNTAGILIGGGVGGLGGVDNNGNINGTWLENYIQGPGTNGGSEAATRNALTSYVNSAYQYWRGNSGSVLGASTGGGSSDPQAAAYYGDQIGRTQSALDRLDPQYNVGAQNIQNAFNDQNSQLDLNQQRGQRDYTTNKNNTVSDQQQAKQNIDTSVRQNTNALTRLLGRAGSGNSSASQIAAPYAAARAGSQQRQQVQTQYGRNLQSLDTNFNDFMQNLQISRGNLAKQRDDQLNSLQSGINDTRVKLLETLANLTLQRSQAQGQNYTQARAAIAPFTSQADSLLNRVAELSRQAQNPTLAAQQVAYQAPSLDAYNFDRTGAPVQGDASVYADQVSPYAVLFGQRRQNGLGGF